MKLRFLACAFLVSERGNDGAVYRAPSRAVPLPMDLQNPFEALSPVPFSVGGESLAYREGPVGDYQHMSADPLLPASGIRYSTGPHG